MTDGKVSVRYMVDDVDQAVGASSPKSSAGRGAHGLRQLGRDMARSRG